MFSMIAVKLVIGLITFLLVVRLTGKKSLSQVAPFDLIYTLVLGGILEESIYDDAVHTRSHHLCPGLVGLSYLSDRSH